MFRFLVIFGLAAIALMLIVAYVRGRSGGSSGRGALGDGGVGGATAAGLSTDWDGRPTDSTHDSGSGDWGAGSTDSGGGDAGGGGTDGGGGGSDSGGGGGGGDA